MEDARATFEVHASQETSNSLFLRNQYEQTRAAWWLRLCSVAGICTSAEAIAQLEADTHARYDVYVTELTRAGLLREPRTVHHRTGEDEDLPGSRDTRIAKEIMRAACAAQGREPALTDSGEVCLDEVACIGSEDPRLVMYAKYSGCSTIINKDLPALREGVTYPLHTRFEELLETGRTSSSKPNIQNVRREPGVRECFVAKGAWIRVSERGLPPVRALHTRAGVHYLARALGVARRAKRRRRPTPADGGADTRESTMRRRRRGKPPAIMPSSMRVAPAKSRISVSRAD